MRKYLSAIYIAAACLAVQSCDSFLNRQPDDQLTSRNIFEKATSTFNYLVNVYSYMPDYSSSVGYTVREAASDECAVAFEGSRFFALYTHGSFSAASTVSYYRSECYQSPYNGIREATYFMENVDKCPELSAVQIMQYAAEARFLRAFYYTELLSFNGPVIFLGDKLADFDDENLKHYDRSDWTTIVDWVCNELDRAAEDLPEDWGASFVGRATKGAALAVKAKLLLYSARPLFNGQNGTHIYDNIVNSDGVKVFCTEYDETKWQRAAEAAKAVIDMGTYSLVDDPTLNRVQNYHKIFSSMNSPESIFVKQSAGNWRQMTMPCQIGTTNSYGGVGVTQKLVDCFAMENGYYPVKNVGEKNYRNGLGDIEIDTRSGYSENGYTSFVNPYFQYCAQRSPQSDAVNTMNMYVGREPRFYANIIWSGQTYTAGATVVKDIQFFYNGKNGPGKFQNYSPTGYLPMKFNDPDKEGTNTDYGAISYPVIRYADILLMYVEALNEYDPTNPDILTYWNKIRERAGVPDIETVYPEIVGNKELQRKYIHRERMVELCFENSRFFDCNTWMTSVSENNGEVVGCNIMAKNHAMGGAYWHRTSIFDCYGEGGFKTRRVLSEKNYLLPFNQGELDRVPTLTQNYGW